MPGSNIDKFALLRFRIHKAARLYASSAALVFYIVMAYVLATLHGGSTYGISLKRTASVAWLTLIGSPPCPT